MNKELFLDTLSTIKVDTKKVEHLCQVYSQELPPLVEKIVSICNGPVFLDSGIRVLIFDEIVDAEKDLHVSFSAKSLVPIADCGENDFIVYDFKSKCWAKYNIVDGTLFKKRASLCELLN